MQAHHEKLNRLREDETNKKIAAEATAPTFPDPFWTNGMTVKSAAFAQAQGGLIDPQKEAELDRMRSAASPPMLGADLKFRMCPSPKATKFESDQRHDVQPHKKTDGGGLWGGYCVADESASPRAKAPTFIHTPQVECEDPFSSDIPGGAESPRTHADEYGVRMLAGLDERLRAEVSRSKAEAALLEEFDDAFVTQVYNYLSLGYPALARPYDEELAKISRVPESELRTEDHKKNAKGHIGMPEKNDKEVHCARWKALRIYIFEWARQHPGMSNDVTSHGNWGVRARRGSWGN